MEVLREIPNASPIWASVQPSAALSKAWARVKLRALAWPAWMKVCQEARSVLDTFIGMGWCCMENFLFSHQRITSCQTQVGLTTSHTQQKRWTPHWCPPSNSPRGCSFPTQRTNRFSWESKSDRFSHNLLLSPRDACVVTLPSQEHRPKDGSSFH